MTDKIAEIRARHQRIETTDDALLVNLEFSWANDDRGWLLAEVERLRVFEAAHRQLQADLDIAIRERDEARAEVERLRAEIEPLRKAMDVLEGKP